MPNISVKQIERQQIPASEISRRWLAGWWAIAIYSVFLLATTCYIAAHRHFWFDEVLTYFIGTQPSLKSSWAALVIGADGQPIGFYAVVHFAYLLFGSSPLALRLCAIVPFWLTTLVLYYAVARRTSPLYGFIAALGPPFTVAFQYSFEARPYALVLLFSACSFLAWQFAKQDKMRILSVPAITLTLAAAISTHYNAVLLTLPLLLGEVAYTLRLRKVDIAVLAAVGLSFFPILFFFPHIHGIHNYSLYPWTHTSLGVLFDIYFALTAKLFVLTIIGCAAAGLWAAILSKNRQKVTIEVESIPHHEIAVAGGYLLLPMALFALSLYTKAFHYRYVIATVVGISIFVPYVLWIFRVRLSKASALLCSLMILSLIYTSLSRMRSPDENEWGAFASYSELFNPATKQIYRSNQALVLGDGPFLLTAMYGNAMLRDRSFYLTSPEHSQHNSPILFGGLRGIVPGPFHVVDLSDFKQTHRSFLMYNPAPWLLHRLVGEGDGVRIAAYLPHNSLYEVTLK